MKLPSLKDNVVLITGSTRGIGWEIARQFASQECKVILNGFSNQDLLNQRVEEIQSLYGCQVEGILADFSDPKQIIDCYKKIFSSHKKLDIVVNNAGVMKDALIGMIAEPIIQETFQLNALGVIHSMQQAARIMSRHQSGSIINLSSIIGTHGNAGQLVYASTKSAVIGATKSAAKELAPKGIRVNGIAPGFIDTDMTRSLPEDKHAALVESVKMGRIGTPEDVAMVALFLGSDMARYVTGQIIGVDGGMLV